MLFFSPPPIYAISDPLSVPNNKYGIHVAELTDLKDAANLVNANGGDWGHVTLVIQDGDRNVGKWQEVFNSMRRLHLIPIIRLATHPEGDVWKIPQKEDAGRWADFLNTLLWPTANRYVVLFNEPNHSKEWGRSINPEEYADVALEYANKLKEKSPDFFLLPAGFDMSASSDGEALEASEFVRRMYQAKPEFFSVIDGWTSHSYPNPGFSSSPYATGKGTIASFQWELQFLQSIGITKNLPVFITETGWLTRAMGNNLVLAASGIWTDPRIVAITPFLLNYQGYPFDTFSWKKLNSQEFYPHYELYQKLIKIKGEPNQHESFAFSKSFFPDQLVTNSTYSLEGELVNTGQGILDPDDGYTVQVEGATKDLSYFSEPLPKLEPSEKRGVKLHIKTPLVEGDWKVALSLVHAQKNIIVEEKKIQLIPPPSITINTRLGWKKIHTADHVLVLVYDQQDTLLHKFQDLKIENGSVTITGLYNMIPGNKYRVVIIAPYYLPRQHIITFKEGKMTVTLKRLLPFDFNKDGTLNPLDMPALLFTKPNEVFTRFF